MRQIPLLALAGALLLSVRPGAAEPPRPAAGGAGKLFVEASGGDSIEVIDLAARRSVKRVKVGKRPAGLALGHPTLFGTAAGSGSKADYLYVTVEDSGQLVVVDADSLDVVHKAKLGVAPGALTLTRDARFAYVSLPQEGSVAVVEFEERFFSIQMRMTDGSYKSFPRSEYRAELRKKIPLGERPGVAATGPATGRIYVAGARKLHVLDPSTQEQLFEVELPGEALSLALGPEEERAYAAVAGVPGLLVVDLARREVANRVELPSPGTSAPELLLSPDEKELWVTSCAAAAVSVYALPELKPLATVPVGKCPRALAWQPGERGLVWVSDSESNTVRAIDPAKRAVVATVAAGPAPRRLAVLAPRP